MGLSFAAYSVLTIFLIVLTVVPHQARSSSRGSFGVKNAVPPRRDGLCASSITVHGYKCEEHEVTTKDGFILGVQRIPEGRSNVSGSGARKQPVIIQHGVLVDGMTWLTNPPEQNLPMILAEKGFDVWIANSRGTRYSRHTSLKPSHPAYWDWSWDEMVTYDLPALFDHVFNQTGQTSHYVGHSLGTLVALASLAEGKLMNQLKSAALLSPIAYLSHMTTLISQAAARAFVGEAVKRIGFPEFDPKGIQVVAFIESLCANLKQQDCSDLFTAFTGPNCCLNSSAVRVFYANEPQPTSTKNMVHLAQTVRYGFVAKFNYVRPNLNIMHYGQLFPPIYDFSNIPRDLSIFMSYGGADALSDVIDVRKLLGKLKSHDVNKLKVQFIKEYGHVDFIMASNAKDLVYNSVIEFFESQL